MSLWDNVTRLLAIEPWHEPLRTLSDDEEALQAAISAARANRQSAVRPWRPSTLREALGVPAVFSAVTMISNVVASLTLKAYYNGSPVPDDERPRVIVRPNPFTTAREFLRELAYSQATRGEGWIKVAKRDGDGNAMSVLPLFAPEVQIEDNGDPLRPTIRWRGQAQDNDDMRQIILSREPPSLRGQGPLQVCGAAISVAVEAQEWAANFFADNGVPSINLHSEPELTAGEAQALREQWLNTPPNTPQVTSGPLTLREVGANVPAAQMLDSRLMSVGDVARMFQMPGSLLEYSTPGSSLTYQNIATEFDKFLRGCLLPNYLEPIEQAMSDLLPRSWVCRFNTDALLRADIKTRFEVYESAITKSGVLTVEEARAKEGMAPGDIENAPVPFAPPQALPSSIPPGPPITLADFRCPSCHRKLAEQAGSGTQITCRCGTLAVA